MQIRAGWNELGRSVEDRPLRAYSNFDAQFTLDISGPKSWTLIVGGTHGDERATVPFLETFISDHLEGLEGNEAVNSSSMDEEGRVMVLPLLNPDGYARDTRYNARGVDLNRNFPERWSAKDTDEPSGEAPLSEPESKVLHDLLMLGRPTRIVSLHWALSEIDPDGEHSYPWAQKMWEALDESHRNLFHLREPDDAAPLLSGSLGSFCRLRLRESTSLITLELPYHPVPERDPLPEDHFASVRALWESDREGYWSAVYPAVETMLLFAMGIVKDTPKRASMVAPVTAEAVKKGKL